MSSPATKLEASSAEERDQIASSDDSPHFHEKEADDARPEDVAQAEEVESASDLNLDYNDNDEEPALHARTYFALAAMFMLNMVQVLALQSPPAVVCRLPQILAASTSLTSPAVGIYRRGSEQCCGSRLGSGRTVARSSCRGAHYIINLRHVPGQKDHSGRLLRDIIHWLRHRTWIHDHGSPHCRPDPDRIWLRYGAPCILHSQ